MHHLPTTGVERDSSPRRSLAVETYLGLGVWERLDAGSESRHRVETVRGPMTMQGYTGCLRAFPDIPYGRGRRWPRLFSTCEPRRSNDKNKAITALQRRVVQSLVA
jgi:hypothetical protein